MLRKDDTYDPMLHDDDGYGKGGDGDYGGGRKRRRKKRSNHSPRCAIL